MSHFANSEFFGSGGLFIATTVATPVFSPTSDTYASDQSVSISDAISGVDIYYTLTTNGSVPIDPTTSDTLHSGAISVAGDGAHVRIKAFAVKAGYTDSNIVSAEYFINYP